MDKSKLVTGFTISALVCSSATAFALKEIKVCGTKAKPDKTYLDCAGGLKNIYQLKALEKFTKLYRLNLAGRGVVNDKSLKYIKPLSKTLVKLSLHNQDMLTDEGLKVLESFTKLEELDLYGTKITDNIFKTLAKLPNLKDVNLGNTKITGVGFKYLKGHKNLRILRMRKTEVGNEHLKPLGTLKKLNTIGVQDTNVSEEGKDAVLEQNPEVTFWL